VPIPGGGAALTVWQWVVVIGWIPAWWTGFYIHDKYFSEQEFWVDLNYFAPEIFLPIGVTRGEYSLWMYETQKLDRLGPMYP
jgi:hypothetical protein